MSQEHESVDLVGDETVRYVAYAALVAALTAALAQLSVPIPGTGVPFSLQPFGVFLAGLVLGPLWGGFAMALYMAAGVAGAPVFSNGGAGVGYLAGQTGGFILGYLVAAVVIGAIAHRRASPRTLADVSVPVQAVALVAGLAVVYGVGTPWMAWVAGLSLPRAAGIMAPFVPPDLLKLAITVGLVEGGHLALE